MKSESQIVYLTYDQAQDLVERIAKRAENFDYTMSEPEKEAMAQLFSMIGTNVSDIVDVSNLADNYVINAEIVRGDADAENYQGSTLQDALFTWKEDGETYYCIQW